MTDKNKQTQKNPFNIFVFLIASLHGSNAKQFERNILTILLTLWAPGSSSPGGFFLRTYFFEGVWIRKVGFD